MGLGLCALKISRLYFFPKMRFFPFDCTKFSLHLCELKSINCKIDILQKNFFFSFCCLLPLGRAPVRSLTQASVTFQENRGLGHFFSLWTFQFFSWWTIHFFVWWWTLELGFALLPKINIQRDEHRKRFKLITWTKW